jgi:predicted permease
MTFTAQQKSDDSRLSNNAIYIARLKPGATLQQAQAQIDTLNAANLDRFPQFRDVIINAGFRTVVLRLQDQMVKDVRATLHLMWGGALFVLVIGCVNVANLALVRSRNRLKELATRLALGAGTRRIAQQLVSEHLVLALGSAVVGIAIAYGALLSLDALSLEELPRSREIGLDAAVVAYTFAAALAIGLLLGLIPLVATLSANMLGVLREEGRTATSGRGARSLRRGLVMVQVGCAFVLLVGAGLLFASFRQVLAVDPGFTTEKVLTGAVSLPESRYGDADALRRFTDEALRRLRDLPGVRAAGVTDSLPLGNRASASAILAEGYKAQPGESFLAPAEVRVSHGYFESIGASLVNGRFVSERDTAMSTRVTASRWAAAGGACFTSCFVKGCCSSPSD